MGRAHFTMIGSRKTPEHANTLLEETGYQLMRLGYIGRSGGCNEGPDQSLTNAVARMIADYEVEGRQIAEIYIPGNKSRDLCAGDYTGAVMNAKLNPNWDFAVKAASQLHPVWDKLDDWAKDLHSRNIFQPLGYTIDNPSGFVLTFCPVTKAGNWTGGTATALKLAKAWFIPILNAYIPEERNKIEALLASLKDKPDVFKRRLNGH